MNCWGEPYPYALCTRHEDVRRYAETLAAEAVRDTPTSTAILEACGQLGFGHGGHHHHIRGGRRAGIATSRGFLHAPAPVGLPPSLQARSYVQSGYEVVQRTHRECSSSFDLPTLRLFACAESRGSGPKRFAP